MLPGCSLVIFLFLVNGHGADICSVHDHEPAGEWPRTASHRGVALLQHRATRGKSLQSTSIANFQGEFHSGGFLKGSIADFLQSSKCNKFYAEDRPRPAPTVVDHISGLFRPAAEIPLARATSNEPSLPPTTFRRMLTYEDVAFPLNFTTDDVVGTGGRREDFLKSIATGNGFGCEMFAVRTPERPVKVITAIGAKKSFAMPAIWKVATTSLTAMLGNALEEGSVRSMHGPHMGFSCQKPANPLFQCEKHTTFNQDAIDADIKVAIVRSPLERFLASVFEHGEWHTCGQNTTGVCDSMVAHAKRRALMLAQQFPHRFRACASATQSYFLSATDLRGKPYTWDRVMRLEEFDDALSQLKHMTGIQLSKRAENTSGPARIKKMYFDAVFSDLETLCSVCKVYGQDFVCLGYVMPERCTPAECSRVGVSLSS